MSVIFPTTPAKVNLHPLPKNAEMITYRVDDVLSLSAWMPDEFYRIQQIRNETNDDFYENHCDGCWRNSCDFLNDFEDEDGEVDWDHPDLSNHCGVYDNGYEGQYCPRGFEKEDTNIDFFVSNMVFEIHLTHLGEVPRYQYVKDTAFLQAGKVLNDELIATSLRMASNVFGYEDQPEGICWGYNSKPNSLREIVSQYFSTPFNNDLLNLETFEENCIAGRREASRDRYSSSYLEPNERFLSNTKDALMIIDAEENVQAFFTMLMAGFKPLSEASHVMLIPLTESEIEKDGKVYSGYITIPDEVNKSWFISPTGEMSGLLVGQL